jgi:hypothetical protein
VLRLEKLAAEFDVTFVASAAAAPDDDDVTVAASGADT